MANVWRLVILLIGLVFIGRERVSCAGELDEITDRLASLEAGQNRLQEFLRTLEDTHEKEAQDAVVLAKDIKDIVEEQSELLQNIQHSLENGQNNNGHRNKSSGGAENGMTGPCLQGNHTVIDDDRRAINGENEGEDMCDKNIQPGWYRFLLDKCSAIIPTECVPEHHCQTDAPTWVDLQGGSLPEVGQEVDARACSHWDGDCCNWEADITVRNCGEYYVYKIEPLSVCDLSFCAKPQY